MTRVTARPRVAIAVLLALLTSSCDSPTENPPPRSISLTVAQPAVSLAQGVNDSVDITISRSNFDKPVTLTVTGVPGGVTVAISPNPVPAGTTRVALRFSVAPGAVPTTATLTIKAEGEGVSPQTATMSMTITVTGSYSIVLTNPMVTVAHGGGGSTIVALTRSGGFAGDVTLAVSGAPAGMTATLESSGSNTSTALRLTATSAVAPGNYTLTITGATPGLPDRIAPLVVRVIAPPSTASISFRFCQPFVPIWFAYQNEGYAWQHVNLVDNAYTFAATEKIGLAWAFQFGSAIEMVVHYTARDEHAAVNLPPACEGTKTLNGSAAGISSEEQARVAMARTLVSASDGSPNFALPSLPPGPLDLVAARAPLSGYDYYYYYSNDFIPDRVIIRRSLDLPGGATIPTLDFSGSEAFAPATTNLIISGAPGSDVDVNTSFFSGGSTDMHLYSALQPASPTTLQSIPAPQLQPGDLHELYGTAWGADAFRAHLSYYSAPTDREIAFGPVLGSHNTTLLTSVPYAIVRGRLAVQAEYGGAVRFIFGQLGGGARNVHVSVTSGYIGVTPATWEVVVPDFTGTPGFNSSWMPTVGQAPYYQVDAFSAPATSFGSALPIFRLRTDGTVMRFASSAATIGSAQFSVAPSLRPARVRDSRPTRPATGFMSRP